jgi:crotonobetainyl-CoA:carnitine CoA-transferase CaiB-like acyl-CoA transferase
VLALVDEAHVVVENFRPGVLERLGLGPDVLLARNPGLVILRVTAFGQDGPYAGRPGFATLAEAMSGFAAINGEADGGPLLPPIALTDEVTALAGAFAVMAALHAGVGQVVDVSLLDSLLQCMGPLPAAYGMTGFVQERSGSSLPYSVPRGTWRCGDGGWVAVSASAESVGRRVMELIGLGGRDDLGSFAGRIAARDEIDAHITAFCSSRTVAEVVAAFEAAHAAAAPVYDMADVFADPQVVARGSIVEADGVPMQGLVARFSATPGSVRWAGRPLGADDPPAWAD